MREYLLGNAQEAWDRWFAQLGELPPEIAGRKLVGGDVREQYDYAEAASYWGEFRPPHSVRYHPTKPSESQYLDPRTGKLMEAFLSVLSQRNFRITSALSRFLPVAKETAIIHRL